MALRARRLALAIGALGCSSFGETTTAQDAGAAGDGGAAPSVDGSTTGTEGGGEPGAARVVFEEGFEPYTDCGPDWKATGGAGPVLPMTISGVDVAKEGTRACRICQASAAGSNLKITLEGPDVRAEAGKRYVLEAFARREPQLKSPQVGTVSLEQTVDGGAGGGATTGYNLSEKWDGITVARAVKEGGDIRAVFTWDVVAPKACVLVDDVVIREVTP